MDKLNHITNLIIWSSLGFQSHDYLQSNQMSCWSDYFFWLGLVAGGHLNGPMWHHAALVPRQISLQGLCEYFFSSLVGTLLVLFVTGNPATSRLGRIRTLLPHR